jgi:hypothetical protein
MCHRPAKATNGQQLLLPQQQQQLAHLRSAPGVSVLFNHSKLQTFTVCIKWKRVDSNFSVKWKREAVVIVNIFIAFSSAFVLFAIFF